ncbi:MAG: protein kinase [Faecalibacterium prausnitzii]|nr:protein kinase [Faecalibacterium prausnitzii]
METEYYKRYEPVFGVWNIRRLIGTGSYGKVFEIQRTDSLDGSVYTGALKIISIPGSDEQAADTLNSGMDAASASAYYLSCVKNLSNEIRMMAALKGHTNIVSYEDHQIYRQPNNIGWDILIRMELLTPISQYFSQIHTVPRQETIQLGIDICRALELCAKYNIIHRDIKPANIFLSAAGDYKLGDFGVARVADTASGASTRIGTVNYMAPEVFHGRNYTRSVDIYSLGLVLYQLLNNNRLPLLPPMPQPITPAAREQAQVQRLNGAVLPPPAYADPELARIILKACAPNPADRYADPAQMRRELEKLQYKDNGTIFITPEEQVFDGGSLGGSHSGSHGGTIPPVQPPKKKPNPPKPVPPPPPPPVRTESKPKKLPPVVWVLISMLVVLFMFCIVLAQFWEATGTQTGSRSTPASYAASSVPDSSSEPAASEESASAEAEDSASTEVDASTQLPEEDENHPDSSSPVSSSSSSVPSSSKPASSSHPTAPPSTPASSTPTSPSTPASSSTPAVEPKATPKTEPAGTNVNWQYEDYGSGVMIYGYTSSSSVSNLVIPAELGGKPVVRIDNYSFTGRTELRSVYIPSSVTHIGSGAFSETSLTSASIGSDCECSTGCFPDGCSVSRH